MINLCILGTRTISQEMADIAKDAGYNILYYVENMKFDIVGQEINNTSIIWYSDLINVEEDFEVICGLTTTQRKRYIKQIEVIIHHVKWASLVHPTAIMPEVARIDEGTSIGRGVIMGANVKIGKHCVIRNGAVIGHDTTIGDYTSILPCANIAGECVIGDGSYIAMSSTIIDGVNIGSNSFVAAGAVVTKDVPDNTCVMGLPAKPKMITREGRVAEKIDASKYSVLDE